MSGVDRSSQADSADSWILSLFHHTCKMGMALPILARRCKDKFVCEVSRSHGEVHEHILIVT